MDNFSEAVDKLYEADDRAERSTLLQTANDFYIETTNQLSDAIKERDSLIEKNKALEEANRELFNRVVTQPEVVNEATDAEPEVAPAEVAPLEELFEQEV